jgi:signal peptidase II
MMAEWRGSRAIVGCLLALVLFTVADLWTKAWAMEALSRAALTAPPVCTPDADGRRYQRLRTQSIVLVPNYLELRYAENCGAAFGLMDESPRWLRTVVFMAAGTIAIGALLWMFVRRRGGPLFAMAVPLVVSGAIGNMVDRVRLGYVVDFIHFHIYDRFAWPTFNIADATITVGVALLLLDGLKRPESTVKAPGAAEPSGRAGAEKA